MEDLPTQGRSAIDDIVGSNGGNTDTDSIVRDILNFLIVIAVGASVIFIVIGGIRYAISGGNQEKVTSAKNTIMYAIIGLVVALLAGVIVNFVFNQVVNEINTAPADPANPAGGGL